MNGAVDPIGTFSLQALGEAAAGATLAGLLFWLKIVAILVPVLIVYEMLGKHPIFGRWGRALGPKLSRLGMSPAATVPLTAGLFLGISHGAGLLIAIAGDGRLKERDIRHLFIFLATCHAVVEDTLLFALVGAPGPGEVVRRTALLMATRIFLALFITAAAARLSRPAGAA